jgi:hypothetical protein
VKRKGLPLTGLTWLFSECECGVSFTSVLPC